MSEESTTHDLVELTRRQFEAANRRDMEALLSLGAPDLVYNTSHVGLGVYEGPVAIRGFLEDWWDAFEELRFEPEGVLDVGNGVTFSVLRKRAPPPPLDRAGLRAVVPCVRQSWSPVSMSDEER